MQINPPSPQRSDPDNLYLEEESALNIASQMIGINLFISPKIDYVNELQRVSF